MPVPKKSNLVYLNDYCTVAWTSAIIKCFVRLMAYINFSLLNSLQRLHFAYHHNRSTTDAISLALHSTLEHLDNKGNHIRLVFMNYSSAFNTIISSKYVSKLLVLGFCIPSYTRFYLIHSPQSVIIIPGIKDG